MLSLQTQKGEYVSFKHVLQFVKLQSTKANNPNLSRDAIADGKDKKNAVRSFATRSGASDTVSKTCQYCSGSHELDDFTSFESLSLNNALEFIIQKRLCYSCLKPTSHSHYSNICQDAANCRTCNKNHPTALHEQHFSVNRVTARSGSIVGLCVVPVELFCDENPKRTLTVYALLDTGRQGNFISKEATSLVPGLKCEKTTLSVQKLTGTEMLQT